ncbi:MAG: rifampin ADP-ribosyl transferase [Gammaproteobacteria bacterium]|jgi:segregation and condensation protein A|nr:rifampin ADP-ribosyl transferase [Gammaproteobacteria bacterium]
MENSYPSEQSQTDLLQKAVINGQPLFVLPEDLYIPPEALEIFLETFEGPLDLLLYLIRKENIDILDIPIAAITQQYMEYITLMKSIKLELAADYLVMAAMLAEIKSRLLLPKPPQVGDHVEEDPRAELIRRLQVYEQMKKAAEDLSQLPQLDKDVFWASAEFERQVSLQNLPPIPLNELIAAMRQVMLRCGLRKSHAIQFEPISVRERMSSILTKLQVHRNIEFTACFSFQEGRVGVVATFIAMLELLKQGQIKLQQEEFLGTIYICMPTPVEEQSVFVSESEEPASELITEQEISTDISSI